MFDVTLVGSNNFIVAFVAMFMIPSYFRFLSSPIWDAQESILDIKESGFVEDLPTVEVKLVGCRRQRLVMMSFQLTSYAGLLLWINFYL